MSFFRTIYDKVLSLWRKASEYTRRDGSSATDAQPPYTHCLNCGTELTGMYCHKCGQHATLPVPKMSDFVKEYLASTFCIERMALSTILNLIFHPGHLVKEYYAGRYSSYVHPLKLNVLILLMLIALFSIFGTDSKVQGSFAKYANHSSISAEIVLSCIADDSTYMAKIDASERDTLTIASAYTFIKNHPQIIDVVDVKFDDTDELRDTLVVVAPMVLVEDNLLVGDSDVYHFTSDNEIVNETLFLQSLIGAWEMLTSALFTHFPLFMLLTTPFLVVSMRVILRRRGLARTSLYLFAFYYMAFVELLITLLFVGGVIFDYGYNSVRWLLLSTLFIYLTVALKQTFNIRSWIKSAVAATIINFTYYILCLVVLSLVSLIVILVIAFQTM